MPPNEHYTTYTYLDIKLHSPVKVDLTDMYIELNIYEDVFLPFTTAKIVVMDTFDIFESGPIVGNEVIEIYVETATGSRFWNFYIYKIDADTNAKQGKVAKNIVTLYLVSYPERGNLKHRVCKHHTGTSNSIISWVADKCLGGSKVNFESNTSFVDFISNFWKPVEIIKYIEENTHNRFYDWVFYQNKTGLNFRSLSTQMLKGPVQTLTWRSNNENRYKNTDIISYQMNRYFDYKEYANIIQGLGATYYRWEDLIYKWYKYEGDFDTETKFMCSLGNLVPKVPFYKNYDSEIIHVFDNEKNHLRRHITMKMFSNAHLHLKIGGNVIRTVDQVYKIDYLVREKETPEPHKLLKGLWFLTGLKHTFTQDTKYTQTMKLIKNAYATGAELPKPKGPIHTWGKT